MDIEKLLQDLRALVAEWREYAQDTGPSGMSYEDAADKLETVLDEAR